ncbi:MAG: phosphopantothenoylcysteine decarboxylase [Opitutales bacterium]|nr:phosphopantothenoylcysteine decarboxylase [Opitutales bacterium]
MLHGKRILLNAGPTREFLDPVRYLSNGSSGKMGYALAQAAKAMGAKVSLVSGPVALDPPEGVETVPVVTGQEMYEAMLGFLDHADWVIGCAAVADLAPVSCGEQKIKIDKETGKLVVELHPTRDIIASLASQRRDGQIFIGFAAETQNVAANAKGKLIRKGLDYIVANDVSQPHLGMNADHNAVQLYGHRGPFASLGPALKDQIAKDILSTIARSIEK